MCRPFISLRYRKFMIPDPNPRMMYGSVERLKKGIVKLIVSVLFKLYSRRKKIAGIIIIESVYKKSIESFLIQVFHSSFQFECSSLGKS